MVIVLPDSSLEYCLNVLPEHLGQIKEYCNLHKAFSVTTLAPWRGSSISSQRTVIFVISQVTYTTRPYKIAGRFATATFGYT